MLVTIVVCWWLGWPYSLAHGPTFTCVRQRACVLLSINLLACTPRGDVCVVRIFARAREPTRPAHGFLRYRQLQKNLWLPIL